MNEGQPNNENGNENCLEYYKESSQDPGLNDANCNDVRQFICEKEYGNFILFFSSVTYFYSQSMHLV